MQLKQNTDSGLRFLETSDIPNEKKTLVSLLSSSSFLQTDFVFLHQKSFQSSHSYVFFNGSLIHTVNLGGFYGPGFTMCRVILQAHTCRVYFPAENLPLPKWGPQRFLTWLLSPCKPFPLLVPGCSSPRALGFHMLWARSSFAFSTLVSLHHWRDEKMEIM